MTLGCYILYCLYWSRPSVQAWGDFKARQTWQDTMDDSWYPEAEQRVVDAFKRQLHPSQRATEATIKTPKKAPAPSMRSLPSRLPRDFP